MSTYHWMGGIKARTVQKRANEHPKTKAQREFFQHRHHRHQQQERLSNKLNASEVRTMIFGGIGDVGYTSNVNTELELAKKTVLDSRVPVASQMSLTKEENIRDMVKGRHDQSKRQHAVQASSSWPNSATQLRQKTQSPSINNVEHFDFPLGPAPNINNNTHRLCLDVFNSGNSTNAVEQLRSVRARLHTEKKSIGTTERRETLVPATFSEDTTHRHSSDGSLAPSTPVRFDRLRKRPTDAELSFPSSPLDRRQDDAHLDDHSCDINQVSYSLLLEPKSPTSPQNLQSFPAEAFLSPEPSFNRSPAPIVDKIANLNERNLMYEATVVDQTLIATTAPQARAQDQGPTLFAALPISTPAPQPEETHMDARGEDSTSSKQRQLQPSNVMASATGFGAFEEFDYIAPTSTDPALCTVEEHDVKESPAKTYKKQGASGCSKCRYAGCRRCLHKSPATPRESGSDSSLLITAVPTFPCQASFAPSNSGSNPRPVATSDINMTDVQDHIDGDTNQRSKRSRGNDAGRERPSSTQASVPAALMHAHKKHMQRRSHSVPTKSSQQQTKSPPQDVRRTSKSTIGTVARSRNDVKVESQATSLLSNGARWRRSGRIAKKNKRVQTDMQTEEISLQPTNKSGQTFRDSSTSTSPPLQTMPSTVGDDVEAIGGALALLAWVALEWSTDTDMAKETTARIDEESTSMQPADDQSNGPERNDRTNRFTYVFPDLETTAPSKKRQRSESCKIKKKQTKPKQKSKAPRRRTR